MKLGSVANNHIEENVESGSGQKQFYSPKVKKELDPSGFYYGLKKLYGFLSTDHKLSCYVNNRLASLFPTFKPEELPPVKILACKGMGEQAFAIDNGSIVITPEMIDWLNYNEEMDALLLHETTHIAKNHFAQKRKKLGDFIGVPRSSEYEADRVAFYYMFKPEVPTKAKGMFVLLERLRERFGDSAGLVHGKLSDRIGQLKGCTLVQELDSEQSPVSQKMNGKLSDIDPDIHLEIRNISEQPANIFGKLDLAFRAGESGEFKSILREIESNIPKLDKEDSLLAIKELYSLHSAYQEDNHLKVYINELATKSFSRYYNLIKSENLYKDLKSIFGVIKDLQFSVGINILNFSTDSSNGSIKKDSELIFGNQFKNLSREINKNIQKNLDTYLDDAVSFLSDIGEVNSLQEATFLCRSIVGCAISDLAIFDKEEGIDFKSYLSFCDRVLERTEFISDGLGILGTEFKDLLWTNLVEEGVLQVLDIEDNFLSASSICCDIISSFPSQYNLKLDIIKNNNLKIYALLVFTEDEFRKEQENSFDVEKEINSLIKKGEFHCESKEFENLRRKTLLFLMKKDTEEEVQEIFSEIIETMGVNQYSFESSKAWILFGKTVLNSMTYKIILSEFENQDSSFTIEEAITLKNLAYSNDDYDNLLYLNDLSLSQREQNTTFLLKLAFVRVMESKDAKSFFINLNKVIDSFPLAVVDSLFSDLLNMSEEERNKSDLHDYYYNKDQDINYFEVIKLTELSRNIFFKGVSFLNLENKEPSLYELQNIFSLSFFVSDLFIRRNIHTALVLYVCKKHVSIHNLNDLFIKPFRKQGGLMLTQKSLEAIDNLATKPEDFMRLKELVNDLVSSASHLSAKVVASDSIGQVVGAEILGLELISAGLQTKTSPLILQRLFSQYWVQRYEREIVRIWDSTNNYNLREDIKLFCENMPHLMGSYGRFTTVLNYEGEDPLDIFFSNSSVPVLDDLFKSTLVMGEFEKTLLLREILIGEYGVLNDDRERVTLANIFLEYSLDEKDSSRARSIAEDSIRTFLLSCNKDELSLILVELLRERFLQEPSSTISWEEISKKLRKEGVLAEEKENRKYLKAFLLKMLDGEQREIDGTLIKKRGSEYRLLYDYVNSLLEVSERSLENNNHKLSAIPFILEVGQQGKAPGTRALQLLGQVLPLERSEEEAFSKIYDKNKGQANYTAWNTVKTVTPNYAEKIEEFALERLGGGSLYTVFKSKLHNGKLYATRVLNPNAWYHSENLLKALNETVNLLEVQDNRYSVVKPLLSTVEEWILREITDESFEKEDPVFKKQWDNWSPDGFTSSIKIPTSIPLGTAKVRPDEFVEGLTLTEAFKELTEAKMREFISLGWQHYIAQLEGKGLRKLAPKVHSDVSIGNYIIGNDGNFHVIDRGMYLKPSIEQRKLIAGLSDFTKKAGDKANSLVDFLVNLPENKKLTISIDKQELSDYLEASIQSENLRNLVSRGMVKINEVGLYIPLEFRLIIRNINAWRQMANRAGFDSLIEATKYRP